MNNLENTLKEAILKACKELYGIDVNLDDINIEIPKDSSNGDYSSNFAMKSAKLLHKAPKMIADELVAKLSETSILDKVEVAGPGFINFWIKKSDLASIINTIIKEGDNYGSSTSGNNERVLVEYISANPTGTLHCGHARGAAWGDVVTRLYKKAGYDVLREYYVNDAGHQIDMLGESLYARYLESYGLPFVLPEDGYHGKDVIEVMNIIKENCGDKYTTTSKEEAIEYFKVEGRNKFLDRINEDLAYFRCGMDSYISEKWLLSEKREEKCLNKMIEMGLTYEADGAFWFKSTEYGDDKDRVLKKSDGFYTYLTPDIANHIYKFERGYTKLVDLWGADHHGYIPRMKAAIEALGYPKDSLEVDIIQMVRLIKNGEEVKMSKRTGNALTIRELVDEIGIDAARYFFVSKAVETQFDMDLDLATKQSNDNPVYYAQYAYARICSIIRASGKDIKVKDSYDLLKDQKETELLKYLSVFTTTISEAAATRSPNKICNYIQTLATYFHSFYSTCKVNDDNNPELSAERLALLEATRITLKNALDLIGVTAPEKM